MSFLLKIFKFFRLGPLSSTVQLLQFNFFESFESKARKDTLQ